MFVLNKVLPWPAGGWRCLRPWRRSRGGRQCCLLQRACTSCSYRAPQWRSTAAGPGTSSCLRQRPRQRLPQLCQLALWAPQKRRRRCPSHPGQLWHRCRKVQAGGAAGRRPVLPLRLQELLLCRHWQLSSPRQVQPRRRCQPQTHCLSRSAGSLLPSGARPAHRRCRCSRASQSPRQRRPTARLPGQRLPPKATWRGCWTRFWPMLGTLLQCRKLQKHSQSPPCLLSGSSSASHPQLPQW